MNKSILFVITALISANISAQSNEDKTIVNKKELIKRDWFNGDLETNKNYGVGTNKTYNELLVNKKPAKKIVVAVIDAGVEIDHPDLAGSIWVNEDEIAGNGIDDDKNGYIDDIHGWNFMVNADTTVIIDTYEATRILRYKKNNQLKERGISDEDVAKAQKIYDEMKAEIDMNYVRNLTSIDSMYQKMTGRADYKYVDVVGLVPTTYAESFLKNLAIKAHNKGEEIGDIRDELKEIHVKLDYQLNIDFETRPNLKKEDKYYGNNDYEGQDANHGTHVAGIIAANRVNNVGAFGIAHDAVLIMVVRAVPDGDEHDEDVANAIRYAVDNGANVINMSFGKGVSPDRKLVFDAIQYAMDHNVLLVQAAGNDAVNNDKTDHFPNRSFVNDNSKSSYICVGAIKSLKNKKMLAEFSNYGKKSVDVFAPGYDIYSSVPDAKYQFHNGTSMASPVVAGVAALVWAYYPNLTALQVKQVLLESVSDLKEKSVLLPGKKEKILFSELCVSGGVINLYQAMLLAEKMSAGK
jgi:subtilisin family serine protease